MNFPLNIDFKSLYTVHTANLLAIYILFKLTMEVSKHIDKWIGFDTNELKFVNQFEYWDKEFKQKVRVTPKEFIVIDTGFVIKGWDKKSSSGIYSNEIKSFKDETFNVKSFKGGDLYSGAYSKDTKHLFEDVWWTLHKVITVYESGEVNKYYLKSSNAFAWNETVKFDTTKFKVELDNVEEKKNGSIRYSVINWKQGKEITADEKKEIDEVMGKPKDDSELPF